MTKEQWNEKKQHYPYNVLDMVFGEVRKPEVIDCLRDEEDESKLAAAIEELLQDLPNELKRIFFMYAKGGLSFEMITKTEELPVEVVRDRIALSLRSLRHPYRSKILRNYLGYTMPMGSVIGDLVGSIQHGTSKQGDFDFFTLKNSYSVISLASIAVAKAISLTKNGSDEEIKKALYDSIQELGIQIPIPDESIAVAAGFVGWCARDEAEVKRLTKLVVEVLSNKSKVSQDAEVMAMVILCAQGGYPRNKICYAIRHQYYPKTFPQTSFLQGYSPRLMPYATLCKQYRLGKVGNIPAALACAFASEDFEDAIRKAVLLGGNSSTVVAATSAIAEAFYGVPREMKQFVKLYFPKEIWNVLDSIRWSR